MALSIASGRNSFSRSQTNHEVNLCSASRYYRYMAKKIRVKFSVQVVDDSTEETDRYISFSEDIGTHEVRQFFNRTGDAVSLLFSGAIQTVAVVLPNDWPYDMKISTIKAVRSVWNLGLKEAKDVVEGTFMGKTLPYHVVGVVSDDGAAERVVNEFAANGVHVLIDRSELIVAAAEKAGLRRPTYSR